MTHDDEFQCVPFRPFTLADRADIVLLALLTREMNSVFGMAAIRFNDDTLAYLGQREWICYSRDQQLVFLSELGRNAAIICRARAQRLKSRIGG